MVRDPVYGMGVDEMRIRHSAVYMGDNYYFYNKYCKAKIENNPEEYSDALQKKVTITRNMIVAFNARFLKILKGEQ